MNQNIEVTKDIVVAIVQKFSESSVSNVKEFDLFGDHVAKLVHTVYKSVVDAQSNN